MNPPESNEAEEAIQAALPAARNRSRARALLAEFLSTRGVEDEADYRRLREDHPHLASELDEVFDEVSRLREGLRMSPISILRALDAAPVPVESGDLGPPAEPRPRRLGEFEILDEVGRGGMGVVYRGRDRELGRTVALKVLSGRLARDRGTLRRFAAEARVTGQLQHPGIVPVYEIGVAGDGRPFLVMKYVKGETLEALLAERRGPAFRQRFLTIFQKVCETLAYAHERRVVHRDLKPSNIMVGRYGEVQVLDWGLAKVFGRPDPGSGHSVVVRQRPEASEGALSVAGTVVGTPAYMAPEQAAGDDRRVDQRADVFALGAILFEFLVGEPLAPSGLERRAAGRGLEDDRRRLDACDSDRELVDLAHRCLEDEPDGRPRDAAEVAAAVGGYLAAVEERAANAAVEAAAERARAEQEVRLRKRTVVLGGTVLVSVLLAGGLGLRSWQREVRAGERAEYVVEEAARLVEAGDYRAACARLRPVVELGRLPPRLVKRYELLLAFDELRGSGTGMAVDDTIHEELRRIYRRMFEDYGVDPLTVDLARAVEEFSETELLPDMPALLDEWARSERVAAGIDSPAFVKLLDLADALDPSESRKAIRPLVREKRAGELRALLAGPGPDEWPPSTLVCVLESLAEFVPVNELGDIHDGYYAARRVLDRHPSDVPLRIELATTCFGLYRFEEHNGRDGQPYLTESSGHLYAALALNPDLCGAWTFLGVIQQETGRDGQARESFARATTALSAHDPVSNRLISQMAGAMRRSDVLLPALEEALADEPDAPALLLELAWHVAMFDPEGVAPGRALEAVDRGIALVPGDLRFRQLRPMALYRAARFEECAREARLLDSRAQGTPVVGLFRAMALRRMGRVDEGREELERSSAAWEHRMAERRVFEEAQGLFSD